ncbi:MAG: hypothetical protein V4438_04300 [Patescibacteria group bacterium]
MSKNLQKGLASLIVLASLASPALAVAEETPTPLSIPELISKLALEANLSQRDVAVFKKIASCESGMRQFDENGKLLRGLVDDRDIGIMQINTFYHGARAKELGLSLYNSEDNIRFGVMLYKDGPEKFWSASEHCWG